MLYIFKHRFLWFHSMDILYLIPHCSIFSLFILLTEWVSSCIPLASSLFPSYSLFWYCWFTFKALKASSSLSLLDIYNAIPSVNNTGPTRPSQYTFFKPKLNHSFLEVSPEWISCSSSVLHRWHFVFTPRNTQSAVF